MRRSSKRSALSERRLKDVKIIAGLGNPGERYAGTYHNVGWLALDIIADRLGIRIKTAECDSLTGVKDIDGERVVLAKPQTFMNLSGRAVKQLLGRYKATSADLLVIYDDIDIEKGTFRFRERGSAGTHNGMRDIVSALGSGDFARLRIGTGKVPENIPLVSYVLADMTDDDRALIGAASKEAADKAVEWLKSKGR